MIPDNAFHALSQLRKVLYNGDTAMFLAQLLYRRRVMGVEFYYTRDDIYEDTGIGHSAQRSARERLRKLGVLIETRRGLPCRTYYRVDLAALANVLEPVTGQTLTDLEHYYGSDSHIQKGTSGKPPQSPTTHVEVPKTPSPSVVSLAAQQDVQISRTTSEAHQPHNRLDALAAQPALENSRTAIYKEDKHKNKKEEKPASPPPVESSEARFARETRQRANGTYASPYDPEASEWLAHLRQTITPQNARNKQVQESYQQWYREFGAAFVEIAWQMSKNIAEEKGKKRLWMFIDLFNEYPYYPKLANFVRQKREAEKVPPAPRRDFEQGDRVTFKGRLYTVDETDGVGDFLELRDEDGILLNAVPSQYVEFVEQYV